jgi:hypothetical protein
MRASLTEKRPEGSMRESKLLSRDVLDTVRMWEITGIVNLGLDLAWDFTGTVASSNSSHRRRQLSNVIYPNGKVQPTISENGVNRLKPPGSIYSSFLPFPSFQSHIVKMVYPLDYFQHRRDWYVCSPASYALLSQAKLTDWQQVQASRARAANTGAPLLSRAIHKLGASSSRETN